jgi:hypothetical protein
MVALALIAAVVVIAMIAYYIDLNLQREHDEKMRGLQNDATHPAVWRKG